MPSLPDGATGGEADAAALRREIASLTATLRATSDLTLATIEPLADLAVIEQRAAEYRRRLTAMRAQLYLPDPRPDAHMTRDLAAFQNRWGDLVRPMLDGDPPATRLAAERWNGYSARLDPLLCDRVPTRAPTEGMPHVGWAWACLADRFFRELAELEVGVNSVLSDVRRTLTAPAESAMTRAEDSITDVKRTIAHAPSPALFLRSATWRLFEAWREIASLRLHELRAQERLRGTTPAFQWLLDISPVVGRRAYGSEPPMAVAAGTALQVAIGDTRTQTRVATSNRTNLARELHRLHYRLALLAGRPDAGDERGRLDSRRGSTLLSIAEQAN